MSKECVKVIVRCRPFSQKEAQEGHSNIVTIDKKSATVMVNDPKTKSESPKQFTFDSVFDMESTQLDVYNTTARPIVESVLDGYNGTIFAYGQTGTGKTFSMQGIRDVPELRGIIPNAIEHIFAHIRSNPTQTKFLVRASYLEIYNEDIIDLLHSKSGKLELKESSETGVYVKDLKSFVMKDVAEMDRLMTFGNNNRSVGSTKMNAESSRSHSIFTITIEQSELDQTGQEKIKVGKLNLVDLAGSERQSKTGATGDTLKEATKINLSLSALGNVISALVDGKSAHIPYRDSKLTRLLQDSLGGNAKTLMVATTSPASYNYEETVSTLRYANRAKNIKNKPKINEDPKDAMLREFQEEIKRLKEMLESEIQEGDEQVQDEQVDEEQEEDSVQPISKKTKSKSPSKPKKKIIKKVNISELDPILMQLQEELDREKQAIMDSQDIEESDRNRLIEEAEAHYIEIQKERETKEALAEKLEQLEQKLLVGGVNMMDKNEAQQLELAKQAQELEEKLREERELVRALEAHEETNLQIEEEFTSLQEEASVKTRKLKKLAVMIAQYKTEYEDLEREQQREGDYLMETIYDLERELHYRDMIIHGSIPNEELSIIQEHSKYDKISEKWRIAHIAHAGNNIRDKKSLLTHGPEQNIGLHRDHYQAGGNEIVWDPLVVFHNVYLLYDQSKVANKKSPTKKSKPKSPVKSSSNLLRSHASIESTIEDHVPVARGLAGRKKHYV